MTQLWPPVCFDELTMELVSWVFNAHKDDSSKFDMGGRTEWQKVFTKVLLERLDTFHYLAKKKSSHSSKPAEACPYFIASSRTM